MFSISRNFSYHTYKCSLFPTAFANESSSDSVPEIIPTDRMYRTGKKIT